MSNPQKIKLDDIIICDDFNIRSGQLSQAKVAEYAGVFSMLPPVSVFQVDGKLFLVDGWHRVTAARGLELEEIQAVIVGKGTLVDAQDAADKANLTHGVPLTPDQRRDVCVRFAKRHPDWTSREIAKVMGCHHSTVCDWLAAEADTTLVGKPTGKKSARQSVRAGGVDVLAVSIKFKEWLNTATRLAPVDDWTPERRARVAKVLEPIAALHARLVKQDEGGKE